MTGRRSGPARPSRRGSRAGSSRIRPWRSSSAPAIGLTRRPGRIEARVTIPVNAGEPYSISVKRTIAIDDHRLGDPGDDHRREDPRQPRNPEEGPVGGFRGGVDPAHVAGWSGDTQRRSRARWITVGRSVASACRRAGSKPASVSTFTPRAPTGPGDRREVDRPEIRRDARAGAAAVLVHPDRPVALVVEDDGDDPGLLADRGLELRHRHREAAVAGDGDDGPVAMDERGRDRGRQPVAHRPRRRAEERARAAGTGSAGRARGRSCPHRSRRSRRPAGPVAASRSCGPDGRRVRSIPSSSTAVAASQASRSARLAARRASTTAASSTDPWRRVDGGPQEGPRVGADRDRRRVAAHRGRRAARRRRGPSAGRLAGIV